MPGSNHSGGYFSGGPISRNVHGTALVNLRRFVDLEDTLPMSFIDPRPSPQTIVNNQLIAGFEDYANRPGPVVSVEDITRVTRTVDVIDQHTRL